MREAARKFDFEKAAQTRDKLKALRKSSVEGIGAAAGRVELSQTPIQSTGTIPHCRIAATQGLPRNQRPFARASSCALSAARSSSKALVRLSPPRNMPSILRQSG